MKKILICLYYYDPYVSGLTIYAKNLAEGLVKQGHAVTIYCAQHEKNLPLYDNINGVEIIREKVLASFGKGVIMPSFWIKAAILARDYDQVNLHFPNADLGLSSLFIPKEKLTITYHCDINLGKGFINQTIQNISFGLMEIAIKKAKFIVGNSKKYFENSYFSAYKDKFVGVYPPINFKGIEAGNEKCEIPENNNVFKIGFLGRIVYEKGINFLLEALLDPILKDQKFHLYLGGDFKNVRGGSIISELEELIEKTHDKITFLGNIHTTQLKDFYTKIDVLVLPSIDPLESFGMVQVESMFNNTPVIASNMPGVSEVIDSTGFGLLCQPKSSHDLAEQILIMIQAKPMYDNLKQENILKHKVEDIFAFEKTLQEYNKLFFNA